MCELGSLKLTNYLVSVGAAGAAAAASPEAAAGCSAGAAIWAWAAGASVGAGAAVCSGAFLEQVKPVAKESAKRPAISTIFFMKIPFSWWYLKQNLDIFYKFYIKKLKNVIAQMIWQRTFKILN